MPDEMTHSEIAGVSVEVDDRLPTGLVRVVDPRTGYTSGYCWLTPPPIDAKFQEQVDRFNQLMRQANA